MKTYIRILEYVKPYWKHLTLSVVFTILFAIFSAISVYLTIPLLDTLFQESSNMEMIHQSSAVDKTIAIFPDWVIHLKDDLVNAFNHFVFRGDKIQVLFNICILVFFSFLLKNIFGYLQAYFLALTEYASMKDLRDVVYQHLHQLPMSYFKQERVGNLISRLTNDVTAVQASISATFLNLIREPLTIIMFLGIALSISWRLLLLSFLVLPVTMVIITWIGFILRRYSTAIQAKMADITSILQETISGVKIVKAFGMEKYENKKFMDETNSFLKLILKVVRIRNTSSPITEILSVIVGVIIIYYGGILVLHDKTLTASEFIGFLFAIFQLMPPIKELSSVNNRIQESSAAADRIFEILDTQPAIRNIEHPIKFDTFKDSIEFRNVSFHYEDSDELILDNLSFKVKKGEILAFVGPSGGGKSTLVDLIPRFYDPSSGTILLDNMDIKDIRIEDLRRQMGIVTQETFLFNESITKNIAYGLSEFPFEKIVEASKTANAHNFIMEMPHGYDTIIGERGVKISGGQRQRLSIARALLKNPEIMIFDEATSALDNESELLVQEAIERLMINRTTFVIAHRLSTIRNANNIIVLDRGKVIQYGTHDELIQNEKGLYRKFYEMQFRD
jgi:subfamily B ATP-binding cassette protein MsbA